MNDDEERDALDVLDYIEGQSAQQLLAEHNAARARDIEDAREVLQAEGLYSDQHTFIEHTVDLQPVVEATHSLVLGMVAVVICHGAIQLFRDHYAR